VFAHTPSGVRRSVVRSISTLGLATGSLVGILAVASPAVAAPAPAAAPSVAFAKTVAAPAHVITRVSISASRTNITAYDPVAFWGRVFYGTSSVVYGESVVLQQYVGPGWRNVARSQANSSGYANFTVYPSASAIYRFYYGGGGAFGASGSGIVTITAKPATKASRVLALAASRTGDWYVFGAAGPNLFDCSGLTQWVYKQVGVNLPHLADAQKSYGFAVSAAQARPGDLIIFVSGGYGYHAGIYAGGGYMYDAPHEGTTVGKHKIYGTNVLYRRLV
jgi:cell wall-associated NlpC family hydrolase